MATKKIRLSTGSEVTAEGNHSYARKLPEVQRQPSPADIAEESDAHSMVMGAEEQQKEKKKVVPTQIDVYQDVFKRIRKEMGMYKYVPLSTSKMQDLWWQPTLVTLVEKSKSMSPQFLNIHTNIILDSAPNIMIPTGRNLEAVFRSDVAEVLTIAFLIDRFLKELHSEKVITYDMWFRDMARKFRLDDPNMPSPVFAKNVLENSMSQAITRVPKTFQLFLCKKPTWSYIFPSGCASGENRNSVTRVADSGFKYEYRVRLFIIDVPSYEELPDDEEDLSSLPETQPFI